MNLAFTFQQGKILAEGKCARCLARVSQELEVPALMVSTVGIVNALFKKNGVSNRLEIKVPGEYLCESCGAQLKETQYAEFADPT